MAQQGIAGSGLIGEERKTVGSESTHLSHELCDNPACRECRCPPCPTCKGTGALIQFEPDGYSTFTCHACGGCGAQL
jgi:hypothetical protein